MIYTEHSLRCSITHQIDHDALIRKQDTQIAIEELRKSYLEDFIDVIGAQKTAKLMRAEREFGRIMMERMKGKDRPRDKGRGPGSDGGRPMR